MRTFSWLSRSVLYFSGLVLFSFSAVSCTDKLPELTMPDPTDSALTTFYDFTVNDLDGNPVSLQQFRGKKIVVLNTASQCGYTPQYADWEAFYEAHQDKVVVLGFPCNDFGGQEPGSSHDISTFCTQNYGITFPMFEKLDVKGPNKAPLYKWLTSPFQNGWNSQEPTWNFCKYVLDENGTLIKFFDSPVKPNNPAFLQAMGL